MGVGLALADHLYEPKKQKIDISPYKVYTIIIKVYKGFIMTVKVEKSEYKKELFSLPMSISEELRKYTEATHQKKSHIVAEALEKFLQEKNRKLLAEEAKSMFGIISANTPDIQVIKANRYKI